MDPRPRWHEKDAELRQLAGLLDVEHTVLRELEQQQREEATQAQWSRFGHKLLTQALYPYRVLRPYLRTAKELVSFAFWKTAITGEYRREKLRQIIHLEQRCQDLTDEIEAADGFVEHTPAHRQAFRERTSTTPGRRQPARSRSPSSSTDDL